MRLDLVDEGARADHAYLRGLGGQPRRIRGATLPNGPPLAAQGYEAVLAHIRVIHERLRGEYGWTWMHKEFFARGLRVRKERVLLLKQTHGTRAKVKRMFLVTNSTTQRLQVAPNRVQWRFTPSAPHLMWTGDITYLLTDKCWLYLAAVLDLQSCKVVGWSLQAHMHTELVRDALLMACFRLQPAPGLTFHRDRSSRDCSKYFQDTLKTRGTCSSMSRKGNCWYNAPTETCETSSRPRIYTGVAISHMTRPGEPC